LNDTNILAYKAPPRNEGYDLICIHPNPENISNPNRFSKLIKVQVKSRYATDASRTCPLREKSLESFDFLIAVFLNIGKFFGKNDGSTGKCPVEFYTMPNEFVKNHYQKTAKWQQVNLKRLEDQIRPYRDEDGFEQIAKELGIPRPRKKR